MHYLFTAHSLKNLEFRKRAQPYLAKFSVIASKSGFFKLSPLGEFSRKTCSVRHISVSRLVPRGPSDHGLLEIFPPPLF